MARLYYGLTRLSTLQYALPVRKDSGVNLAVRLTKAELRRIDEVAKAQRNTRSGIVRLALDRFLEKIEVPV